MFPFFSLYVTTKFGVGMTEVGLLFTIYSASSVVGSMVGGAITDKFGRRWILLFGIFISGASSLFMGFVNDLELFYLLTLLVGFLENTGGPAQQAMVADLVPSDKLAGGYGIQRVVVNLSVTVGPAIGGLIASKSYFWLFILDFVLSTITAVIVYLTIPETMPQAENKAESESVWQAGLGYKQVLRDGVFMVFIFICMLVIMVYAQINSTLSVYLRDVHGIPEQQYGYLLSLNAAIVVLLQFWVARRTDRQPPMLMLAWSAFLYAVGFAMFGVTAHYAQFIVATIIITFGEMINAPVAQALVARLSPEDMRGRYMAVFGFSWTIPYAIGPLAAGFVMDRADPRLVWYASGVLGVIAAVAFIWLNSSLKGRFDKVAEPSVRTVDYAD